MPRLFWIPAGYGEAAERVADLVRRGVIRPQPHWRDEASCLAWIAELHFCVRRYFAIPITIEVPHAE